MGTPRSPSRLGDAIKQVRAEAELTQTELAEAVGKRQARISEWEGSAHLEVEEALDLLAAIDAACGQPKGTVLRRAGYINSNIRPGVLEAVENDDALDDLGREVMSELYRIQLRHSRSVAGGEAADRETSVVSDLERSLGEEGLREESARRAATEPVRPRTPGEEDAPATAG